MTPLPKRKHSTRRKGKRLRSNLSSVPALVRCSNCGKTKLPHKMCKYCHK